MPNQTQTPPGLADAPQGGPFSAYLQPRPIDTNPSQPGQGATGWESGPVGAGKIALGFLQGIRQNRVADYIENEKNAQAAQDVYQNHLNGILNDDDLTSEGRKALSTMGNTVMAQHTQHQLQDVKGSGPAKFFKELLIHATGGPMKVREPIDFTKESGNITKTLADNPQYSQKYNFDQATQKAQTIIEAMKRDTENPGAEEVKRALLPTYYDLLRTAPKYAPAFAESMAVGFHPMGSAEYGNAELLRTGKQIGAQPAIPATEVPPGITGQYPVNARAAGSEPEVRPAEPGAAPVAGATGAPPATAPPAGIQYTPGYGPQRFAMITGQIGRQNSPVRISPQIPVSVDGQRTMAREVEGSRWPGDNGYWDANTQQRISGNVVKEGIQEQGMETMDNDVVHKYNTQTGQWEPTYRVDPVTGKRELAKRSYALTGYRDPVTGQVVQGSRGQAAGQVSSGQALQTGRFAEEDKQHRAIAITAADNRLQQRIAETNKQLDQEKNRVLAGNIDIAVQGLSSLGIPVSQQTIQQAMNNPKPLLDIIEQQRAQRLADHQRAWQQERASVDQNFPTPTQPPPAAGAAAPRTAAPPAGPPKKEAPTIPIPDISAANSLRK